MGERPQKCKKCKPPQIWDRHLRKSMQKKERESTASWRVMNILIEIQILTMVQTIVLIINSIVYNHYCLT